MYIIVMSASKDRGWMYKRRNNEGHLCSYYQSKVSEFLNFAFSIKKVVEVRTLGSKVVFRIKCPCSMCKIKVFKERHEVEYDLWSNGFIRGYTTWYAQGERKSKPKEIGKCSKSMEVDDVRGCTRMILDMLEADHEQAPNLHSEPLEEQTPNSYAKEYYDMLEVDDEPLYEGCQKYSTLEAATRLLNWKAECNVPEETYNRALSIFKDMLPGDKLVGNFYETKKILRKLNLPREKIHACKNHCMLFYGKVDSFLSKCKVCGHYRYKNGGRNNVPNLVLAYFPIAPRLQRMYMSKKIMFQKIDYGIKIHNTDTNKTWKLGSLKRTVRNKARIETRLNREPRNFAPDIHCSSQADSRLNIFKVPSRRLFDTGTKRNLTNTEKHKAHTYILLNCEDVHPFLRLFDNYMMQEDPYIDEETLDRARDEKFAQWFKEHIQSNDGNEHLKVLARGPMRYVESYKGYFVNGYKFHTLKHGDGRVTHNSGVCVKGSTYNEFEYDYYGLLVDVLEVNYRDSNGRCVVVLFKCDWFEPIQGVRVNRKHNLVDVKYKSKGCQNDPFILASQAEQVYYAPYPSMTKDLKDWWAVVKAAARSIYEVTQCSSEVVDDNVDVEDFFQENEMPICSNTADATISLVTQGEMEEVGDLDVGDAYMEVSENEEEFVDTYDDSDDDTELNLSDHFSDEDEVDLSDHSLND
ncbi:putative transposase-associated domain-containing protein [Tanacetum coccineum]